VPFPCVGGRLAARFLIRCGGGVRRARRQRLQAAPHAVTAACRTRCWLGVVLTPAECGIACVVRRATGKGVKRRHPRGGCRPAIRAMAARARVMRRHPRGGCRPVIRAVAARARVKRRLPLGCCRPAIRAAAARATESGSCASSAATPTGRCCGN